MSSLPNAQHRTAVLVPEVEERLGVARSDMGILEPLVEDDEGIALHPEFEPVPYRWIALDLSNHTPGENQLQAGGPRGLAGVGRRLGPLAGGATLPEPVSYRAPLPDRFGEVPGDRPQDRHGLNEVGLAGSVRPDQDIQAFQWNLRDIWPEGQKAPQGQRHSREVSADRPSGRAPVSNRIEVSEEDLAAWSRETMASLRRRSKRGGVATLIGKSLSLPSQHRIRA